MLDMMHMAATSQQEPTAQVLPLGCLREGLVLRQVFPLNDWVGLKMVSDADAQPGPSCHAALMESYG